MDSEDKRACKKIRECFSSFISEGRIETWRSENDVTLSGKEEEVVLEPCDVDEVVCGNSEEDDFFYMYETVFRELHVRLPFTKFESEMLEKLNCAPVQMGPNAWAFVRAYEILCGAVGMRPSLGVFFSFHEAKVREKGSWLYIGSQNNKGFLAPFASNYKSYNKKFFRVRAEKETCSLIANEEGKRLFPVSWQKYPLLISGFKVEALTEEELEDVTFLKRLKPVSCKKFIEKEKDPEGLWNVISRMSTMTDAQIRAILKEKKAGKMKQETVVDEKKVEIFKSPMTGIIGRKRPGDELKQTTLNFSRKSANQLDGKKKKEHAADSDDDVVEVSEMNARGRWYSHMKAAEFELIEMEALCKRQEIELEEMRGKNKELEMKIKKCGGHEGEIIKLKKAKTDLEAKLAKTTKEKEDAESKEDVQKGITASLQSELGEKDKLIKDLQIEAADRYDFGFEFALEQVKIVHPDIDLAEVSILKVINNGKLLEATEENVGKVDNLSQMEEKTGTSEEDVKNDEDTANKEVLEAE